MNSVIVNDLNDAMKILKILLNNSYLCSVVCKRKYYENGNGCFGTIFIIEYEVAA